MRSYTLDGRWSRKSHRTVQFLAERGETNDAYTSMSPYRNFDRPTYPELRKSELTTELHNSVRTLRVDATSCLAGVVPSAVHHLGEVVEVKQVARGTYHMRVTCPKLAQQIVPGQFFMIRDPRLCDPMLGRPFALLDVFEDSSGEVVGIDFGFVAIGKMTRLMAEWRAGDPCELWGPLGNGFPIPDGRRLFMVAGGIGQTPFRAVAREALGLKSYGRTVSNMPQSLTLCYGARGRDQLAFLDWFELPELSVQIATDDGSVGRAGFVTELLKAAFESDNSPEAIYCCGPEPMMAAVAKIAEERSVPCWLSLETPMACGFGICFSCVTKVRMDDGSWDYRRTCVEGPVFPAEKLCLS